MAIELHHLDTHGMMEQACNVLDGVVHLKERIAELEKENQTLAEDVSDKIESITELMELVEKYKSEKADLKEERRWRKFSEEKPNEKQWILVYYPYHSNYTTGVEVRRWDEGCKYDVEMQEIYEKWMPLPKEPEVPQ